MQKVYIELHEREGKRTTKNLRIRRNGRQTSDISRKGNGEINHEFTKRRELFLILITQIKTNFTNRELNSRIDISFNFPSTGGRELKGGRYYNELHEERRE